MSDVAETWWDAGGNFACPDTDSFSARCQNREGHSPLAIHTAAFVHVLVLLAAGFALFFGESINLTWLLALDPPADLICALKLRVLGELCFCAEAG